MNSRNVLIGVASMAAAACGGGAGTSAQTPAPVWGRVVRVEAVTLPQRVELYGTVEAERTAMVSSRVMATVTAVAVRPGDAVTAGQVLVEIDPTTARGQEAQARGALAQAQAAVALGGRNLERFQALAAKGAASQLELDLARMQYEQAKGAEAQGQGALDAAASVARESRVVAPFAGWIVSKLVEVGDLAAPGRPLVVVESASGRRLALAVPETLLVTSGLKLGARLPVRIDALTGSGEIEGTVEEIDSAANPASHTFTVKVNLPGVPVPAGVSGRAWLAAGSRSVLLVPRSAVTLAGGLTLVVVRDSGGKARSRVVTLGAATGEDRVEVLSGVAAGDEVVAGLAVVPADGTPVTEARL